MHRLSTALACAGLVVLLALAGCGGGGGSSGTPGDAGFQGTLPGGSVNSQGQFVVETQASSDYRSVTLSCAGFRGPVITGFYQAWFTRVQYTPSPGWLCGRGPGDFSELKISREDGTGSMIINTIDFGGTAQSVNSPCWSPDGTRIAFTNAGEHLIVCNRDGSRPVTLMKRQGFADIGGLTWTPNDVIYFALETGSQWDLWAISTSYVSARPTQITNDAEEDNAPDASPDGRWLAWSRRSSGGDWNIYRMPIGGDPTTDMELLVGASGDDYGPRWSPDGRYIAYVHGGAEIWLLDVLTGARKQLTKPASGGDSNCDWTADGRYVVFLRNGDLYRIPFDGSPGDEGLVASNWGSEMSSSASRLSRYRVLVGPSHTDWGNYNPPFGTKRPGVLAVYSTEGLLSAVSFLIRTSEKTTMIDRTPGGGTTPVCEVKAGHVRRVLEENGPGMPKTVWVLEQNESSPGAVLVIFNPDTGKVASVIALWDQVGSAAAAGPRVGLEDGKLVVRGDRLVVYDGKGHQVSGPTPVAQAVLDGATGRPIVQ